MNSELTPKDLKGKNPGRNNTVVSCVAYLVVFGVVHVRFLVNSHIIVVCIILNQFFLDKVTNNSKEVISFGMTGLAIDVLSVAVIIRYGDWQW